MSEPGDHHDLEGGEISRLYARGKPQRSPAALDERILDLARSNAPAGRRVMPGWLPLASAAGVVGLAVLVLYPATELTPTLRDSPRFEAPSLLESSPEPEADALMQDSAALDRPDLALDKAAEASLEAAPVREKRERPRAVSGISASTSMPSMNSIEGMPGAAQRLQEIRELMESGDSAAAQQAYRALREAFPDYPIPEDLREVMGDPVEISD